VLAKLTTAKERLLKTKERRGGAVMLWRYAVEINQWDFTSHKAVPTKPDKGGFSKGGWLR